MKRRQFFKVLAISGVSVAGLGAAGYLNVGREEQSKLTIDYALDQIDQLSQMEIQSTGAWDAYQIFSHCAQSVEFSMSAFPVHKSSIFKSTLGAIAFSAFASKGKMTHGLDEEIPGAPTIKSSHYIQVALKRLEKSLIEFKHYKGELAPHFAYGQLTKQEYALAHVMHLNNHLKEIEAFKV